MFSSRTTIGHSRQKRFGRNTKRRTIQKTPQKRLPQQEKLSKVVVEYDPYDEPFSLVEYFCPLCGQKLWLGYSTGRRNMVCFTYGEEYILNIKRMYD